MIDIQAEQLLSLKETAAKLPKLRGGQRPHVSTIYRWTSRGCRGVKLETIQVGGSRCTSLEALQRFFAGLSKAADPVNPAPISSPQVELELQSEGL